MFGFWFLCVCIAVAVPTPDPEEITISADTSQVYDINDEVNIDLDVKPKDCFISKYSFDISGGEIDREDDIYTFTSGVAGEFDIYVEDSDIVSNTITVKFEDKKAIEQARQEQIAAEQAEKEQRRIEKEQAQAARQAEKERSRTERQAKKTSKTNKNHAKDQNQNILSKETMVWLSATGEKYHNKPDCGNMNPDKARQVTLSEAKSSGYDACSKCY